MLENISLAELIDNYLGGRLSQEEKIAFEQRLTAEAGLAEQVSLQRKITAGLQSAGRLNMLALLKEEDAKMPAYQPEEEMATATEAKTISFNPTSRQMYYWAAAAVLVLLVPVFMLLRSSESGEQLAHEYFRAHKNQWVSTDGDSSLSAQAMEHYEEGNYAMALHVFESMLGNDTAEAEVQFYKGNSYLALKKTPEAVQCFEAVLGMPANKYTKEAEWYLALSYVQADNEKQAKKILKGIIDNQNHPYHKEAQDLMKKL